MKLRETGYAAVNILTKPPHIMMWSIRGVASQVRETVVENWPDRNDRRSTWMDAKKDGVRVRKITIATLKD